VRFVDEEDREYPLASKVFDMARDGEEDVSRGRAIGDAEGVAEMTIEVASTEATLWQKVRRTAWLPKAWRAARVTQVLPAPDSPVTTACLRSWTHSTRSLTTPIFAGWKPELVLVFGTRRQPL